MEKNPTEWEREFLSARYLPEDFYLEHAKSSNNRVRKANDPV